MPSTERSSYNPQSTQEQNAGFKNNDGRDPTRTEPISGNEEQREEIENADGDQRSALKEAMEERMTHMANSAEQSKNA